MTSSPIFFDDRAALFHHMTKPKVAPGPTLPGASHAVGVNSFDGNRDSGVATIATGSCGSPLGLVHQSEAVRLGGGDSVTAPALSKSSPDAIGESCGGGPLASAARTRVLLVDDDAVCARSVARALRQRGFDVTVSTVPAEIATNTKDHMCDVALLDWHPHGNKMRQECFETDTPFVVLTGDVRACLADLGESSDGVTIIEKPGSVDEIEKALRKVVGNV